MKTKEELNAVKKEIEAVKGKLAELTDDELKEVVGCEGIQLANSILQRGKNGKPTLVLWDE